MKIHVVQKGETLWKIAQKYGVDFEELKQMNAQLSNPDMVMPGMKIRVPSTSKQVKKEKVLDKEMKKYPDKGKKKEVKEEPKTKHPYKDISEKAMPVIKEDDMKKPKKEKEVMPMKPVEIPQIPMMEQHMEKYPASVNLPTVPHFEKPKYDVDIDIDVDETEVQVYQNQTASNYSNQPTMPMQQPMMPMNYYHPMPYCMPMNPVPYQVQPVHQMPTASFLQPQLEENSDNDYDHYQLTGQQLVAPTYPTLPFNEQDLMESSSSSVEMPQMPNHLVGVYEEEQPAMLNTNYPAYDQGNAPVPPMYGQNTAPVPPPAFAQGNVQAPAYGQGFTPMPPAVAPVHGFQQHPCGCNQPVEQMPFPLPQQGYYQQPFYPQAPGIMPPFAQGYPGGPVDGFGDPYPYNRTEDDEEESE